MGGFTKLQLKNTSIECIEEHNALLRKHKVKKSFKFYSQKDVELEYQYFLNGEGNFPEDMFPKDKINSYEDFKLYWNPNKWFCPNFGSLKFDCYFNRTTKNEMNCIKNYIIDVLIFSECPFEYVSGEFEYFLERCDVSKIQLELIKNKIKIK